MTEQLSSFDGIELTSNDELVVTNIVTTDSNPASVGLDAPVGSLALSTNGRGYYKHNTANTDWVTVITQLPNELASILPLKSSLSTSDRILLEDSGNSFSKGYSTIQSIVDLVSVSGSLPYYEDFQEPEVAVIVSTTPITVLSVTTQNIPVGKYRIAWSYLWNTAKALSHFNAKVLVDGVEVYAQRQLDVDADQSNEFNITCSDNLNPISFFKCFDFVTETIEIQVFTDDTTYQASIWNKIVEIQRVG
jgi:hypothetical protein